MCPLLLLLQVDCCSRLQRLLSTVHMLQSAAAREHCVLLQVAMSPLRSTGNVATALLYVALQCTGICCHSSAKFTFELECGSSGVKMYCNLSIPVQCHQYSVICCHPWTTPSKGTFAIITMLHKRCNVAIIGESFGLVSYVLHDLIEIDDHSKNIYELF